MGAGDRPRLRRTIQGLAHGPQRVPQPDDLTQEPGREAIQALVLPYLSLHDAVADAEGHRRAGRDQPERGYDLLGVLHRPRAGGSMPVAYEADRLPRPFAAEVIERVLQDGGHAVVVFGRDEDE